MLKAERDSVPTWWRQKALRDFRKAYSNPRARRLFFIGAGLSRSAGLPDWPTLLEYLANEADRRTQQQDSYTSQLQAILDDSDPLKFQFAGSMLKDAFDALSERRAWRNTLETILQKDRKPSSAHRALVNLIDKDLPYHIITTNYDRLIEDAITERFVDLTGFKRCHNWHEDIDAITESPDPYLFKLHGDIGDPQSPIVLTKEEYDELYTERPLSEVQPLQVILNSATCILFLGFSHDDVFLHKYIQQALKKRRNTSIFTLLPIDEDLRSFQERARDLAKSDIQAIAYSPDDQHAEFASFLEYMSSPEECDKRYEQLSKRRKPTVVMLYSGGTIGSKRSGNKPISLEKRKSRHDKRLKDFSEDLLKWHKPLRTPNTGHTLNIEIEWEVMPENHQLLSENATPDFWNQLTKKTKSITYKYFSAFPDEAWQVELDQEFLRLYEEDKNQFKQIHKGASDVFTYKQFTDAFSNRLILGFVLLTGTDTLAYTAAALSFGTQHLPCPIVVTGANEPPRPEEGQSELSRATAKSDAWKNLTLSLYFLQVFGHRLTEVFVCFGDTVHHAVNLRKRSVDIAPFPHALIARRFGEPFMFRNLSFQSEYMFKHIDGIFCNNFYPRDSPVFEMSARGDKRDDYRRHVRRTLFNPERQFETTEFSRTVAHVQLAPCFPVVTAEYLIEKNPGLRAVHIESYPSGTYPTIETHEFSQLLLSLYKHKIPAILTSLYGILPTQEEYETYKINGHSIPVLKLYGTITETALPLLSLVIGEIDGAKWEAAKTTKRRINLIAGAIEKYFQDRPDIISNELKHIGNKSELRSRYRDLEDEVTQIETERNRGFKRRGHFDLDKIEDANRAIGMRKESPYGNTRTLFILRNDFLSLINELTFGQFERMGITPHGFQSLSVAGFKIGLTVTTRAIKKLMSDKERRLQHAAGSRSFERLSKAKKDALLSLSGRAVNSVVRMLRGAGFADISLIHSTGLDSTGSSQHTSSKNENFLTVRDNSIFFLAEIRQQDVDDDIAQDKYSLVSYSDAESIFFQQMSAGEMSPQELELAYRELVEDTLKKDLPPMIWFIVGVLRGAISSTADFLHINSIAKRPPGGPKIADWLRVLNEAAKCQVVSSNKFGGYQLAIIFS